MSRHPLFDVGPLPSAIKPDSVLRESREAHERKYDQEHIADLNERLEATNKSLRQYQAYGYCK